MSKQFSPYASSLNLPKSPIDIHCNLNQLEPALIQAWEAKGLYVELARQKKGGQPFFELHDGPPYANGSLHPGHVVNKVLKDILLKSKRLSGYFAPFKPGWDCHGLPIELKVEKQAGSAELSPKSFRERCCAYADSQIELQKSQFKRLGIWANWEQAYETKQPSVEAQTLRLLGNLYEKGLVVRGHLPVYWCTDCKSSLSDYEVEYQDTTSQSAYVKFLILESPFLRSQSLDFASLPISVLIWTTAVWTLPANQAVAVHPSLRYQLVSFEGTSGREWILVAESRAQQVLALNDIKQFEVILTCNGSDLYGTRLCHPFLAKEIPLILGEHVTSMSGTGLVHIAPAHGEEDFELGKKYQLPLETPVGVDGFFDQDHPLLSGVDMRVSLPILIDLLKQNQTLFSLQPWVHSYPYCWRHRQPLIYRATPQWFIPLDKCLPGQNLTLREAALQALKKVSWVPEWGATRMQHGLQTRPDWCISRQRFWGLPLPLLVHKSTGKPHPNNLEWLRKTADMVEAEGVEAWMSHGLRPWLEEGEALDYLEEHLVLDVWFDSGSTHFSTRDAERRSKPADVYLEGADQFRGWFMSSLLTKVALDGEPPYREVVSHGFVVDQEGYKMSKSLGNTLNPQKLIERFGAETLRAWVACADYQAEVVISDEILERVQGTHKKIRNVLRYLLANLQGFDFKAQGVSWEELLGVDQWALFELQRRQTQIIEAYRAYQFQRAYQSIFHFCSVDLSSSYLEVLKDRLYVEGAQSRARRSAQTVLFHTLHALVRWILPILTFTSQELWPHIQALTPTDLQEEDVSQIIWWEVPCPAFEHFRLPAEDWDRLNDLRHQVLLGMEQARSEKRIKNSLDARVALTLFEPASTHWIEPYAQELHYWLSVSRVSRKVDLSGKETSRALLSLSVEIEQVEERKCLRCWMRRVEGDAAVDLCARCYAHQNPHLEGMEERRWF